MVHDLTFCLGLMTKASAMVSGMMSTDRSASVLPAVAVVEDFTCTVVTGSIPNECSVSEPGLGGWVSS